MKKRVLAIITVIMMLVGMFPVNAEDGETCTIDHVHDETCFCECGHAYCEDCDCECGQIHGEICDCDECHSHEHEAPEETAPVIEVAPEQATETTEPEMEIPAQTEELPVEEVPAETEPVIEAAPEQAAETTEPETETPAQTEELPVEEVPAETEPVIEAAPEQATETVEPETEIPAQAEELPVEEVSAEEVPEEEAPVFGSAPMMLMSTAPTECTHPNESLTYIPSEENPDFHIVHCTECDTDINMLEGHSFYGDQDNGDGTHTVKCLLCGKVADWSGPHTVSCQDPTVCTECGATGLTGFEPQHSYSFTCNENGTHTAKCNFCEDTYTEAHYSACWSNNQYHCDGCQNDFETELPVRHMGLGWQIDNNEHYQYCFNCGTEIPDTRREHIIDETIWYTDNDGHHRECSVCRAWGESGNHINCKGGDTCLICGKSTADGITLYDWHDGHNEYVDAETHKQVCSQCGEESEPMPHSVSCADPTTCTQCGATGLTGFEPQHSYSFICNEDGTHTAKCCFCDAAYTEAHYSTCMSGNRYHCDGCNNDFETELPAVHTGLGWQTDSNEHYQYCFNCGTEIPDTREEHSVDETVWYTDECTHYNLCSVCQMQINCGNHVNCEGGDTCFVCGKSSVTDGIQLNDQHVCHYEYFDGEYHVEVCNYCNKRFNSSNHNVDCKDPTGCVDCGASMDQITNAGKNHTFTDHYEPLPDGQYHVAICDVCSARQDFTSPHTVSCVDPTVCTVCGATGLSGIAAEHELAYSDNGDGTHTITCRNCDYRTTGNHTVGCDAQAAEFCSECSAKLTGEAEVKHWSLWYQQTEEEHWLCCGSCGQEIEGSRGSHQIREEWSSDAHYHFHDCEVCGYRNDLEMHINCTGGTDCLVCGEKDPEDLNTMHYAEMTFDDAGCGYYVYYCQESDPYRHYAKCKYCGEYIEGEFHNDWDNGKCDRCGMTPVYCENEEDHNFVWQIFTDAHYLQCDKCGLRASEWEIHHDCNGDNICDICNATLTDSYMRVEDHKFDAIHDDTEHWTACVYCGQLAEESVREAHQFTDMKDGEKHWQECEGCAYRINEAEHTAAEEWSQDQDGTSHWKCCSVCGEMIDSTWEEHTLSYDFNVETHTKTCSVCGYRAVEEEHTLRTVLNTTDEEHTVACVCGYEITEPHAWLVEAVEDIDNKSVHYLRCEICSCRKQIETVMHENLPMVCDATGHHQLCPVAECWWNEFNTTLSHSRMCHETPGVCTDESCTYTGLVDDSLMNILHEYEYTPANEFAHTGKCVSCSDEILFSHWDEDGDGVCELCGFGAAEEEEILTCKLHTAAEMEYDATGHWYTCTVCGNQFGWSSHGSCAGGDTCMACGMSRDECDYFEEGHVYVVSGPGDEQYHYARCAFCGKAERWEHAATCTNPGVCAECGETVADGAIMSVTWHNFGPYDQDHDEYSHWYICRDCGQMVDRYPHYSEAGMFCDTCGIEMSEVKKCTEHDVDYTDIQRDQWCHYYICRICGEWVDSYCHYNCDPEATACAGCGLERSDCLQFDAGHWADWEAGMVCIDEYSHGYHCRWCGELTEISGHWMNWDEEKQAYYCEGCGATDVEPHACRFDGWQQESDHLHHYQECELCHSRNNWETHTDANADGICDVCGLPAVICHHENEYIALGSMDGKSYAHMVECRYCHEWYAQEPHVDADGNGICDLCLEPNIGICKNHVWAKDGNGKYAYNYDENAHYLYCENCFTKGTVTEHIWSEWVAGPDQHMHICKACGYTEYGMHVMCGGNQCKACGLAKAECNGYSDHYYDTVDTGSDNAHQLICRYCKSKTEGAHSRGCFDPAGICTACGHHGDDSLMTVYHSWSGQYEYDGFKHWQVCMECNEIIWESTHYDYNNDGYCDDSNCKAKITPCPGHVFGEWEYGDNYNHSRTCSVCGTVEWESHYNCAGGDTCLACGVKKTGAIYFDTYHYVNDYEHYESDANYHWNVCARCGEPQNKVIHQDWDYDGICNVCGNIIGHDHAWTLSQTIAATCAAEGKVIYTCACGQTREEAIAKIAHAYQLSGTTEATCTAGGTKIYTCPGCGSSYSETVSAMKEHTWTVSGTDAATCKDAGATHYSCSVCGATREESIPATGEHTWTLTDEKPSTCTEAGYRTYTCTGCDTTRTEEVARKPHAWTETGRKEATCIETGHVNYVCGQCGATRTEMLDLIEHPWTETGRLDPTCMEDGYVDYVCDYCAEERHDVLLATGHSYGEFTSNFGSTHSRVCSECGDVETQSCQWIVVEIGDIRCSSCTVCRFVKTEIIGLEVLDNLGENNMAIAKTVNTENVKMEIDLSAFVVPGTDPEDPEQKPVETHLTITESSEALPENCSVVKMFNISLEVNGEQQTNVGQKVVLSLPLSELSDMTEIEKDTGNYKLFVLGENGELIEVEYEIVDGMLILNTEIFGMFVMLTAEEAALLAK